MVTQADVEQRPTGIVLVAVLHEGLLCLVRRSDRGPGLL